MATKRATAKKQVTFTCKTDGQVDTVCLAGDFNDWNPTAKRMTKTKNGGFQLKMKLPPGEYQYKYIVNDIWLNDPDAEEQVMNPYGTLNSIMRV